MGLTIDTTDVTVTLDETAGLQNGLAPAEGDSSNNDISPSLPPAGVGDPPQLPPKFYTYLNDTLGLYGTEINFALSGYNGSNSGLDMLTVTADEGNTIPDLAFTDIIGAPLDGVDSGLTTLDEVLRVLGPQVDGGTQ